jgi:hypothetical protein
MMKKPDSYHSSGHRPTVGAALNGSKIGQQAVVIEGEAALADKSSTRRRTATENTPACGCGYADAHLAVGLHDHRRSSARASPSLHGVEPTSRATSLGSARPLLSGLVCDDEVLVSTSSWHALRGATRRTSYVACGTSNSTTGSKSTSLTTEPPVRAHRVDEALAVRA